MRRYEFQTYGCSSIYFIWTASRGIKIGIPIPTIDDIRGYTGQMPRLSASSTPLAPTPWHVWAVGLFFVALSGLGGCDQIMLLRQDAGYFQQLNFSDTQNAYFSGYPLGLAVLWSAALLSALSAAILLLLRTRWAVPAALIAVLLQALLNLVTFGFMGRWQTFGPVFALFDVAILALTAGLFFYSRAMSAHGVLR